MTEWRTGRKVFRTIYRDGVLCGLMDTPELAALVVQCLDYFENGLVDLQTDRDMLEAETARLRAELETLKACR